MRCFDTWFRFRPLFSFQQFQTLFKWNIRHVDRLFLVLLFPIPYSDKFAYTDGLCFILMEIFFMTMWLSLQMSKWMRFIVSISFWTETDETDDKLLPILKTDVTLFAYFYRKLFRNWWEVKLTNTSINTYKYCYSFFRNDKNSLNQNFHTRISDVNNLFATHRQSPSMYHFSKGSAHALHHFHQTISSYSLCHFL